MATIKDVAKVTEGIDFIVHVVNKTRFVSKEITLKVEQAVWSWLQIKYIRKSKTKNSNHRYVNRNECEPFSGGGDSQR